MSKRRSLTPEFVDSLKPPIRGEQWIGDGALKGFGLRLWANTSGGNIAYAVRVRDSEGIIRRETFSVWSDWTAREKALDILSSGENINNVGVFLDEARSWADDRIRALKGIKSRLEIRYERSERISSLLQSFTLEEMAIRAFKRLERSQRSDDYVIQLRKLFYSLSSRSRSTTLMQTDVRQLADEIANPALPVFQSRTLQSFVGHLFQALYKWHGPVGTISDALTRRISQLRTRQKVPHPDILSISDDDFKRMFDLLDAEETQWRSALAVRLYFATGAKMRRVLAAEWDQIVDGVWYPYSPDEREYWFMGQERLDEEALRTLARVKERLTKENRESRYIFPRLDESYDRPIANVRRYWRRLASLMGWNGLPLSHVVQRHKQRNTPSYIHMYSYLFVPMVRASPDPAVVSKIVKQQAS